VAIDQKFYDLKRQKIEKTFHYSCYFDGACEPVNPCGNMGIGAYVVSKLTGEELFSHSGYFPSNEDNSNNVAEYLALIKILEFLIGKNLHREKKNNIVIYGDSMLVIKQMRGRWGIKAGRYVPHAEKALGLLSKFKSRPYFDWIPRDKNTIADDLSKAEMIANKCDFMIQPNGTTSPSKDMYEMAYQNRHTAKDPEKIEKWKRFDRNKEEIMSILGYDIEQVTQYQFRISGWIDLYPTNAKYCNLLKKEWGVYPAGDLQNFLDYIANN